jgi:hypothetical protein
MRVELSSQPYNGKLTIDGHLLPYNEVSVHQGEDTLPLLTVKLPVWDGAVITLTDPKMGVVEETREALIAMGWTPPADELYVINPGEEVHGNPCLELLKTAAEQPAEPSATPATPATAIALSSAPGGGRLCEVQIDLADGSKHYYAVTDDSGCALGNVRCLKLGVGIATGGPAGSGVVFEPTSALVKRTGLSTEAV